MITLVTHEGMVYECGKASPFIGDSRERKGGVGGVLFRI